MDFKNQPNWSGLFLLEQSKLMNTKDDSSQILLRRAAVPNRRSFLSANLSEHRGCFPSDFVFYDRIYTSIYGALCFIRVL